MGVYSQLDAQKKTFAAGSSLGVWLKFKLAKAGQGGSADPPIPAAAAVANGVVTQAQSTMTAGNHMLTVNIRQANGVVESFQTGSIAFNAVAATVEGAIDTAATAAGVTGWTNGDITVGGVSVDDAGGLSYTFDGVSVAGRPVTMTLDDVDGTGGAWGAQTQTTRGQTERVALAVLLANNVITGNVPEQDAATSVTAFTNSGDRNHNIPANVVKFLMREAAAEDANNATYHSLDATLFGAGRDRSPLVEERVPADNTSEN